MILVQKGENFKFEAQLRDGKINRFIKVELFQTVTNTVIGTYSLNHVDGGFYQKNNVPTVDIGVFMARYTVYKDVGLTKKDRKYSIRLEYIRVESIIEQLTEVIDFGDGSTV